MLQTGTNVYSVLFYAGVAIVVVLVIAYLINMWRGFATSVQDASDKSRPVPSWTLPVIKSILVVTALIVVFNFGWNALQSVTTHSSSYQNPAEVTEKKDLQEFKLPSQKKMNTVSSKQKQYSEKPYKNALDSFDKSMQQESEKIRKRSMGN